jgi:hypothetical protein
MKQIIVLLGRLDAALDAFHKKVDEKYQWLIMKWKLDFYDDIILSVGKKRSSAASEEFSMMIDVVLVSFRDARQRVKSDINDLYN